MIFETRHLVFSNSSLKKAFAWYQQAPSQTDLPMGVITAVTPNPGGGATVMVQPSGATKTREVTFLSSKTLGVLLLFCRRQKIPIPRDAEKDISVAEDGLVLIIRGQFTTSAPPH